MSHPSYRPSQPSYPRAQPSHPTQPDYRRARASGTAAVGSSSVYAPTRQMPAGVVAREPVVPQYGSPMSGPPSGLAYDSAPPGLQPPGPRRGRGVPVLASLAVLLLLVGGVMTALYVTKNSQLGDTKQDVAAGEAKIKDLEHSCRRPRTTWPRRARISPGRRTRRRRPSARSRSSANASACSPTWAGPPPATTRPRTTKRPRTSTRLVTRPRSTWTSPAQAYSPAVRFG
jgi:hypothetical protein